MNRLSFSTLAIATLSMCAGLLSTSASPAHWELDIKKFEAASPAQPLPAGGVVFVGSSSIRMWTTLKQDFPGVPLVNHGFGGSELEDSVFYADRIVLPYKPDIVVLYAGDNDIAGGKTPARVLADFQAFRTKIHATLPKTKIIYLSTKECPARADKRLLVREANQLIAADCAQQAHCTFVDVNPPLQTPDGGFRSEMFLSDKLHLSAAGYRAWTQVLAPHLKQD